MTLSLFRAARFPQPVSVLATLAVYESPASHSEGR
jgi:hypothetical protein